MTSRKSEGLLKIEFCRLPVNDYFCSPGSTPGADFGDFRGVVERFIAPVLKTGDPSRGPGVRIPPPLPSTNQSKRKPRNHHDFEVFCF